MIIEKILSLIVGSDEVRGILLLLESGLGIWIIIWLGKLVGED